MNRFDPDRRFLPLLWPWPPTPWPSPSSNVRTTRRRRGLTIVELLAATALSSLLMIALIGVLKSISTQRRLLNEKTPPQAWRAQMLERFRRDFADARTMSLSPTELRLQGFGGRSARTGEANQRRAEVRYSIVDDGRRLWLARHASELDGDGVQDAPAELVCQDVSAIDVLRTDVDETPVHPLERSEVRRPLLNASVPPHVRLVLFGAETGPPLLDERLLLRFEPQ